jgi:MtfA peptidase
MHLSWPFRDRRRELVHQPFPSEWVDILEKHVQHYALLTPDERVKLHCDLRIFLDEKNWEGALDFRVTVEVKVTVSAIASLLTIGFARRSTAAGRGRV